MKGAHWLFGFTGNGKLHFVTLHLAVTVRWIPYFVTVVAFLMTQKVVVAQDENLTVTVVTDKVKGTLSAAQIQVNEESNRVKIGSLARIPNWIPYKAIETTDPVAPPEDFELIPTTVTWQSLKQVDFLGCDGNYCKAVLTMRNGQSREVFVWREDVWNRRVGLGPDHIKVVGKMMVAGQNRDVEFQGYGSLLRPIVQSSSGSPSTHMP